MQKNTTQWPFISMYTITPTLPQTHMINIFTVA